MAPKQVEMCGSGPVVVSRVSHSCHPLQARAVFSPGQGCIQRCQGPGKGFGSQLGSQHPYATFGTYRTQATSPKGPRADPVRKAHGVISHGEVTPLRAPCWEEAEGLSGLALTSRLPRVVPESPRPGN